MFTRLLSGSLNRRLVSQPPFNGATTVQTRAFVVIALLALDSNAAPPSTVRETPEMGKNLEVITPQYAEDLKPPPCGGEAQLPNLNGSMISGRFRIDPARTAAQT